MDRRSIHRGLVALTLAVGLMLAGVQPAAAKEPGFRGPSFDRLLNSVVEELESLLARIAARPEKPQKRGFGIDPNGNWLTVPEEEGEQPDPNG
ncbi:MAG TPA: hypothetical protein VE685_08675 [Thermoanaerobaculia bacterium]|nr:hypothetical protein [Thermoanaerobaculia bacterium]